MSSSALEPKIHLHRVNIKNFRNIAELALDLSPSLNLFVGQNGQGKTNILEAIALSCSLKPLQPLQNIDLIKSGAEEAEISATFLGLRELNLEIAILPRGKKARLNGKALMNASTLAKNIPIVSFIPAELNMITGSGSLRRRALDLACISLFYEHAYALNSYEKVLSHRNRLFKEKYIDKNMLSIFTKLLIKEGENIVSQRLKTIDKMSGFFNAQLGEIFGSDCLGSLRYQAGHSYPDVEAQEMVRRVTLFGPHLHDVSFVINGLCAKRCASRGQARAIVLAFKIAQMMTINTLRGSPPILILDDIVSELDQNRQDNLLRIIHGLGLQAFFSATSSDPFSSIKAQARVFLVDCATIKPE